MVIVPYTCPCFLLFAWNLFSTPRLNWRSGNKEFKTSSRLNENSPEFSWPSNSERRARHFAGMCWCSSDGFWRPSKTPQLKEAFLALVPCLTTPDLLPLSYPDITDLLWGVILSRCAWWDNEIQTLLGISWISTSSKDDDGNEQRGWCDS